MTMQSEHRGHGWMDNVAVQMTLAAVAIAAIIAIAWFSVM